MWTSYSGRNPTTRRGSRRRRSRCWKASKFWRWKRRTNATPPGAKLENRVTLAVTADQANALKIAEGRGTFALSLRNPEDVQIAASSVPQTLDRLLNLPVQNEHVTAIYRGGAAQAVSFPGATIMPQPAVALPVAGVLQMRAAQQTTSLEKEESGDSDGKVQETTPPDAAASPPARGAEARVAAGEDRDAEQSEIG